MNGTKILILGHGDHGKDEFAIALERMFGLSYNSSSMACFTEFIWDEIGHEYESKDACYTDRRHRRDWWFDRIKDWNTPDRSRLAKLILRDANCYVGMRSLEEYKAAVDLFDFVVWVDASERKPAEPASSMQIPYDPDTMILIDNNGTLHDLDREVGGFIYDCLIG